MKNSRAPSPSPKQVALVIGRLGIGGEIALSFVKKDIKVAITYIENENDARQTADGIKGKVSGHPEVKIFKFDPTSDKAATLIKNVREKLNGLDIVVFASIYTGQSRKSDIFDAEVQTFYKVYQAAVETMPKTPSYFRVVHVSSKVSKTFSDINAALEALVRAWGEDPPSKHATVNAILYNPGEPENKSDYEAKQKNVVGMVNYLLSENSWFINGKTFRRVETRK